MPIGFFLILSSVMVRAFRPIAALALCAFVSTQAPACETDTNEITSVRHAKRIYLAEVITTKVVDLPGCRIAIHTAKVRPLVSIRGKITRRLITLSDIDDDESCGGRGDGYGARSQRGDYVFVFEGMPEAMDDRRGINSFKAEAAMSPMLKRHFTLFLRKQAKRHPRPYPFR